MTDPDLSALEIERRKLANDDARLKLENSFARKWAPALIPVMIGLATLELSYQQANLSANDNRIKQGTSCLEYFHKFDTDPSYTGLAPAQRTATLETLQVTFTAFPECLSIHRESIQNAYLAAPASGSAGGVERLFELNKILARIGPSSTAPEAVPAVPAAAPAPPPVTANGQAPAAPRSSYQIYLHYKDRADQTQVQNIAEQLAILGWQVKPIQYVQQPTSGDVRYYKSAEARDAATLAADVTKIVAQIPGAAPINLRTIDISRTYPNLPAGIMEVWISGL